jgi:large subunit ribosomal protein L21
MFAVIKTGGKQYRVAADDRLKIDKIAGEPGDIVQFGEVLLLGGDDIQVGAPSIAGAMVAAEVIAQDRHPTVIAFKKRRRKNSRRKRGQRQEFTLVQITEILTEGRKPTITKAERPKKAARPEKAQSDQAQTGAETESGTEAKPKRTAKPAAKAEAKPRAKAPAKTAAAAAKPKAGAAKTAKKK